MTSATESVEISRLLAASPERVFEAWTDPSLAARWLTPLGSATAELDVRPGGAFRIVMRGDGQEIEHSGEYLEIEPPGRLVFTWRSAYTGSEGSVVTVTLRQHGEGTLLTLVHERLPQGAGESHGGGWGRMLDRLAELVTNGGGSDGRLE